MATERKVGLKALLSYGCGDLYGGGSFLLISTLFMFYLTDVIGMAPALAGLVVFAGKAWDAISDPLMGVLSDRTKSRFGRRRVYFLAGILPIFASFAMLWLGVKTGKPVFDFLYYFFAYVLFCTVSTMVMIPYAALPTEMTGDYRLRTRLSGARMVFSQLSALLAGTIPGFLVKNVYRNDPGAGFLVVGLVFGALYALPWLLVYRGTWEDESAAAVSSKGLGTAFKDMRTLFRSRSYRLHIGLYLLGYSALDVLSAVFIFFVTYYLGRGSAYTLCLGAMLVAQLLALPLHLTIANRIGKGRDYAIGAAIVSVGALALFGLGPSTPTAVLVALSAALGTGLSAVVAMPWAMLPESADVDELTNGEQRAGVVSGTFTLARKLVQATVLWLFGIALGIIGYVPNAEQAPGTLLGIRILFAIVPLALVAIGSVVALRYPVTPSSFAAVRAELDRLRAGGDRSSCDPQARAVLEKVTGRPYGQAAGGKAPA